MAQLRKPLRQGLPHPVRGLHRGSSQKNYGAQTASSHLTIRPGTPRRVGIYPIPKNRIMLLGGSEAPPSGCRGANTSTPSRSPKCPIDLLIGHSPLYIERLARSPRASRPRPRCPWAGPWSTTHPDSFEGWLEQVDDWRDADRDASKELKRRLHKLRKAWIKNIEDYEFPVVTLGEETEAEAVCTIFETLNRTGVKLSVFDLLAARFWPENVRIRDLWDDARTKHPILEEFGVDPYYILQAIAIYTAKAAPSCKRSDVLKMEVEQIQAGWEPVVRGVAEMVQMLRDDCGVVLPGWLPYNPMLIPAGAVFAKHEATTGPQVGAIRNKMKRWFWCSVFGQVYENAPNSQAVRDVADLTSWFAGGEEPDSVRNFSFEADVLRETTVRQRALYRGCIALILRSEARDFHSGKRITASMVLEKKIDDHHVFPKGYLADSNQMVVATLRDCVLNRTLIDKETNIRIGKNAPAVYLADIETQLGAERLDNVLRSHLLPGGTESSLREGRFSDFVDERQQRFAERIEEVTR